MIIDAHTHTGCMLNFIMTEEMLLESMDKYNIDYCLCSNGEATEFDHNHYLLPANMQKTQESVYRTNLKFARANRDKIGVLPWVKPYLQGVTDELERLIAENLDITFGIKLHPFHSVTRFDSPRVQDYIRLAQQFNLTVLTHTGMGEYDNCTVVAKMAEKYPDVSFVMGHMGLGTDNSNAIELVSQYPNLYGDTAWVSMESAIRCIEKCGSEKLIFGSDNTIDGVDTYDNNGKGSPSIYRKYFGELKAILSKEDYENLMYKNAVRIYRLSKLRDKC
ncbi:MAG TPA: amidohydrolase [Clostridiales bacterium]|nr:amidohydrolase [Clostridiales bacterium]